MTSPEEITAGPEALETSGEKPAAPAAYWETRARMRQKAREASLSDAPCFHLTDAARDIARAMFGKDRGILFTEAELAECERIFDGLLDPVIEHRKKKAGRF